MFVAKYPSTVNSYLVSVLKNVVGCSGNPISEVYTGRTNHFHFTDDIQDRLKNDFAIRYDPPAGNDGIIDDTGFSWDSSLKLQNVIDYVERNSKPQSLKELLFVVASKEKTENPNRLALVRKY